MSSLPRRLKRSGQPDKAAGRSWAVETVGPRDIDQAFPLGEAFHRLPPLVLVETPRPTEPHAFGLGALAAVIGAGLDQVPLKGREAGQDGHHKFALRRAGVAPRIVQALELGTLLGELVQDVQEIAS